MLLSNIKIIYVVGREMLLADTLSGAYIQDNTKGEA